MHFEIIGGIENVETIAVGGIGGIMRLRRQFGDGRRGKRLADAHGIGRKKMKMKRFLS